MIKLIIIILFFLPLDIYAADKIIPKFVSLKPSEANVRAGPGVRFPIKWILVKKHLPLEILDHFDNWYRVRDEEQQQGWIHKNLVSKKRFFIIKSDNALLYKNPKRLYVLYHLESGVRGKINSCRSRWCEVTISNMHGWIKKEHMWGIYAHEII